MTDTPPSLTSNAANIQHMEAARTLIDVASIPAINHPTAESIDFGKVKFHDVLLTDDPTNIVSSNNKNVKTKLQSIMNIAIDKINTAQIRNAAKSLGIKGCRKLKKIDVCSRVIEWVSDETNAIVICSSPKDEPSPSTTSPVNRRPYLNVIFLDIIRPLIATKGESLS